MKLKAKPSLSTPHQHTTGSLRAGAAQVDLTPRKPSFLYGYPHVPRTSTGLLDPLLASALYLADDAGESVMFIGCDLIWVPRDLSLHAADQIAEATGLAAEHIIISATHTHSGPVTSNMLSNATDPVVPPADPEYLEQLERAIVQAGRESHEAAQRTGPVKLSFAWADGSMLGTNRHHPDGLSLPQVPVLWCREAQTDRPIAVMAICTMHPTVLHEDSKLISGDFPGQARRYLQQSVIGPDCPLVYHMGAAGNQSPRHVVKANTLEEMRRLGQALARAVADTLPRADPMGQTTICVRQKLVDLHPRQLPTVEAAQQALRDATHRYESLQKNGASRPEVRTAECDCFGAQETLTLAQAARRGQLAEAAAACTPAAVRVIRIGPLAFVAWPGEVYVEYALQVREKYPQAWIMTLAGGDLQGYLVTQAAVDEHHYEAGNALFDGPISAGRMVQATLELLAECGA
ncbi:MAG: neutral/alkaline non-lysosomal ceramidase N-terminal domain-containing protein [Phycisphaeraceae bacterium]|nr:neutral/alkaline non-lysosomal ceramidase N-terminal domain-containing protein [Phycisphaeraceae bacterium]